MKDFLRGMIAKPRLPKRLILCLIAVCVMGICVSWLNLLAWGTDPCSVMNFGISQRLGMSFGNWQALLNVFLFVIVIFKGREYIGFGTVFNMFLVGYSCDFMTWLRNRWMPGFTFTGWAEELFPGAGPGRWLVLIVMMVFILFLFVFAVSVYMSVDLGTAPYDAIPFIIAGSQERLSFRTVRIIWDCAVTVIGYLMGGTVGIVTVLMAFTIGPMAAFVSRWIERFIRA